MKNLKKVLCLALAFAMVLGLCVSGLAAKQDVTTLSDWNEVTDKTAATLLNAFEIMNGDADGNFYPDKEVSRAEAAAMLSRALWGGKDDVALYNGNNVGGYTDVIAGNWYMGYVNYMTVQKIMKGDYGTTNFRPNGTVTGYELLKMCLVALGYDPATEGLEGAGWDVNTMALATAPNYLALTFRTNVANWNAPLSRMNAARIIANMLSRQLVEYSLTTGVAGSITSQLVGKTDRNNNAISFGAYYLGMGNITRRLVSNETGSLIAVGGEDGVVDKIDPTSRRYNGENAYIEHLNVAYTDGEKDENDKLITKYRTEYEAIKVASTYADLGKTVTVYTKNGNFVFAAVNEVNEVEAPSFNRAGNMTNTDNNTDRFGPYYEVTKYIVGTESGTEGVGLTVINGAIIGVDADRQNKFLDDDNDGFIDTIVSTELAETLVVTEVAETEKDGAIYMTNPNVKFDQKKYDAGKLKGNFVLAKNCDFEAEAGDHIAYVVTNNSFGTPVYHGYVLETVEGKITSMGKNTSGTNLPIIGIDGVKYTAETAKADEGKMANVAEGTFYLWSNGNIHSFVPKTTVNVGPEGWALVYDAGWDQATTTTVAGTSVMHAEVAAVLPDGTDKVFTIKSFMTTGADGKVVAAESSAVTKAALDAMFKQHPLYTNNGDLEQNDAGLLALVKNDDATPEHGAVEALLVQYSLNADGSINLYNLVGVGTDENGKANNTFTQKTLAQYYAQTLGYGFNQLQATDNGAATEVTTGNAQVIMTTNIEGVTVNKKAAYMSGGTLTYIQTSEKTANTTEKWTVTKGLNFPSYAVADDENGANQTRVALTDRYGLKNGVAAIMLPKANQAVAAAASNLYYVVSDVDQTTAGATGADNTFVAEIYDSSENKTSKVTYHGTLGAQGSKGQLYTLFSTETGFDGAITAAVTNAGVITLCEGNTIHVSSFANDAVIGMKDYVLTKDTKYFLIDGEDTTEVTKADLVVATEAASANQYNTIVIGIDANGEPEDVANHGNAGIVIHFADMQTLAAGSKNATLSVPTAASVVASLKNDETFKNIPIAAGINAAIAMATDENTDELVKDAFTIALSGTYTTDDLTAAGNAAGFDAGKLIVPVQFGSEVKGKTAKISKTADNVTDFETTFDDDCLLLLSINPAETAVSIEIEVTAASGNTAARTIKVSIEIAQNAIKDVTPQE